MPLTDLGVQLREHAPEILASWRELITCAPFSHPTGDDAGALLEVVYGLIEVSVLCPHDPASHERQVQAAVQHGEQRRRSGVDEAVIWHEFEALREAVRRQLAAASTPHRREAQIRLDMAVSVAQMAAVRGYHRPMLEQSGVWDQLIPNMARHSPLLNLPTLR